MALLKQSSQKERKYSTQRFTSQASFMNCIGIRHDPNNTVANISNIQYFIGVQVPQNGGGEVIIFYSSSLPF